MGSERRITPRPRAASFTSGLLLALWCASSVTAAAGETWEGTWERAELPGKHLFLTQTGSQVSGHYDWNDASGVLGGNVSGATLIASFTENRYEGSATLTLAGKKFSGSYTGKNRETGGPIEGPFDGTCVAGACLSNGAPAPSVTSTAVPPSLGKTTLYEAPAAGATASNPLPKVAKKSRELEGSIRFVGNEGKPVEGPSLAAVYAQAEGAAKLCAVLDFAPGGNIMKEDEKELVAPVPSYAACIDAVARVLARNDEIQKAKGTGARAAARVCATLLAGRDRGHSPLHVSCKPTATGLKLAIRPRSSMLTLSGAFHGHPPKLIVGRSAVTRGPARLRTSEFWRAK
jgi:hypothetical protein